jgi:hypothetical protein
MRLNRRPSIAERLVTSIRPDVSLTFKTPRFQVYLYRGLDDEFDVDVKLIKNNIHLYGEKSIDEVIQFADGAEEYTIKNRTRSAANAVNALGFRDIDLKIMADGDYFTVSRRGKTIMKNGKPIELANLTYLLQTKKFYCSCEMTKTIHRVNQDE